MKNILYAVVFSFVVSPALADTVIEYGCVVLARGPVGTVERILPETKVLEPMQSLPKLSIALPPGYGDASVQCVRSDLVPAENDWKVLRAGYPLFITEKATGNTMTIGLRDGRIEVGFKKDSIPTNDQVNRLQARVNQLQTSMQDADFPPAPTK
jgi:hypothetical protein